MTDKQSTCKLTIYTENNVLAFDIKCTADNMDAIIAEALEECDAVSLVTTEDSILILNSVNVVAIDIKMNPPVS